ncbi:MAG: right-handed parallel beta-helix repeat-containing protein, partial [Gemmatimonadetes bacterium]|nr:right-handed parallel beta-helix repeat-containing protein [Gemmatimonadota bacterium]
MAALTACDPDARGATQVQMMDNAFAAPVVRVPVGAGVAFANIGQTAHNIVPADPARWPAAHDTSAVPPGGTRTLTLDSAGAYPYYCSYHGTRDGQGMAGVLVVGEAPLPEGARGRRAAVAAATGTVRRVPQPHRTIQDAVDAAAPGDLVLVDTGTYREEVTVNTPSLVLRGTDRNRVVIDGEFLRPNGVTVFADGVAVENLTVRHHTANGVFWNGVTGYRGRFLTAVNNGDYGLYAFDSRDGLLEDSYASGSPDAGFYIGQCDPCRAVVRRVTAEHNALGFSGTNASGDLHILGSTWRHNRGGIVPNSLDTELHPPQHDVEIRGNLIHDNNSRSAPGTGLSPLAWGNGVVIGGGRDNLVADNVIANHAGHGVLVAPLIDAHWWPATGNAVRRNRLANSGRADIAVGGPTSTGNCVGAQAAPARTAPHALACADQAAGDTAGEAAGEQNDLVPALALALRMWRLRAARYPDWRTQPAPPPQPSMPDAATAPAPPAVGVYAGLADSLARWALPPQADAVWRAAQGAPSPPPGTPALGHALAGVQARLPLTLARL